MPSWRTAPATGGSRPAAAASIAEQATAPCRRRRSARAMRRDAPGDLDGVGEPVQPVHGEHDVGRLGRRASRRSRPSPRPRAAAASAGASLTPSPTITVTARLAPRPGPGPPSPPGCSSARTTSSTPTVAATCRRCRPVAGDQDDRVASRPRAAVRTVRRASGRTGSSQQEGADRSAVDGDEHGRTSRPARRGARARSGPGPGTLAGDCPTARPGRPSTRPLTPRPGSSVTSGRLGQRQPRSRACADDARWRARAATAGPATRPGAAPRRPVAARRDDRSTARGRPGGQRAGLVEQQGTRAAAEPLQRAAALDHHPAPCRPREAGDDRDRGGQQQRAGGGDHQHRHRPDRVPVSSPAPARPGRA